MPWQSEAQRRYLWMKDPKAAKKIADDPKTKNTGLPYHKRAKGRKKARA